MLFLLYARKINSNNFLWYSLIFGLFYDYKIDAILGISVLIFSGLSLAKIIIDEFFNWREWQTHITASFFLIIAFHVYNALYFGYELFGSFYFIWRDVFIDFSVYLVISIFVGLYSAVSKAKR